MSLEIFHPRGLSRPLPDNVLLMIFRYLSQRDLRRASWTCSSWRRAATDSSLWKKIDFREYKLKPSAMWLIARSQFSDTLKSVHFKGHLYDSNFNKSSWKKANTPSFAFLDEMHKKCPNLDELGFTLLSMTNVHLGELPAVRLKKLSLVKTLLYSGWFNSLLFSETRWIFSELTHLDLNGNTKLRDRDLEVIVSAKPPLVYLNISYLVRLNAEGLTAVAKHLKTLRHLELMHTNSSTDSLELVCKNLTNLNHLNVSYVDGMKYKIEKVASNLFNLKTLYLVGCSISSSKLNSLSQLKKLTYLKVSDYSEMRSLDKILPNCRVVYENSKPLPKLPWRRPIDLSVTKCKCCHRYHKSSSF